MAISPLQSVTPLSQWLQAAQRMSTFRDFRRVQSVARGLANRIQADRPSLITLVSQLRSNNPGEVRAGLDALSQIGASIPITSDFSSYLEQETRALQRVVGGKREEFRPVTRSAARSHTILGYVGKRIVTESRENRRHSRETYSHDPSRVEGHFFLHRAAPIPPMSRKGQTAFAEAHEKNLVDLAQFVETQLSLQTPDGAQKYQMIQQRIISILTERQKDWDKMVWEMGSETPSFNLVSEAFRRRDEAIRHHPILRAEGIGPWEFDLIRAHQSFSKDPASATEKDRLLLFGGEWAYLLKQLTQKDAELKANKIEKLRFALEPIYRKLAQGEEISRREKELLAEVETRYLKKLHTPLEEVDLSEVGVLDTAARAAYAHYAEALHQRHLISAGNAFERFQRSMKQVDQVDQLEQEWQVARYQDLMATVAPFMKKKNGYQKRFQRALACYQDAAQDYNTYAKMMLEEDPRAREYTRNSKYRVLFVRLWELHDTVKEILQETGVPKAEDLQILSFAFKTQAQFLRREPKGMEGLEPLVETTLRLGPQLKEEESGIYNISELYRLGGRDWGLNLMTRYAQDVHIVGAGELFGYFGQAIRPETMTLEGALDVYPPNTDQVEPDQFARRGAVVNAIHLGQLEFPATMGIPYLTGLPHTTILAQEGVRSFPIAGPFLGGIEQGGRIHRWLRKIPFLGKWLARPFPKPTVHLGSGAYIQRTKNSKRRRFENFILEFNIGMGNFMNIYGNGTRDIDIPIPSPYADLTKYPEALHLPDYHPTRYSTGMPVGVSRSTGAPIIPNAYDLGRIYGEPSMPMPSGWNWKEFFRNPRRTIKPYAGFWQKKTMFPYIRPGQDSFTIAYGEPIPPESFVTEADLSTMGYGDQLAQWNRLSPEERGKKVRWLLTQLNFAVVREAEMRAGYTSTAGIYGNQPAAV